MNLTSAELLDLDEVSFIFDRAIAWLGALSATQNLSVEDMVGALRVEIETFLKDAVASSLRSL